MSQRDLRLDIAYPLLAHLGCRLAWRASAWLGAWPKPQQETMRTAMMQGLTTIKPEIANDPERIRQISDQHLAMYARETMDIFCLYQKPRAYIEKHIQLQGLEHLHHAQAQGRGVILVLNHYSRLNLLLIRLAHENIRLSMLTMAIDQRNPHIPPPLRRFLHTKVHRLLDIIQGEWLSLGDSLRPMYKSLKQGNIWVILADAYTPTLADDDAVEYPFMGGRLRVSRGIERIARATGARLVYGVTREQSPDQLIGELRPLPEDPAQAHAAVFTELERDIATSPWQWWQWNIAEHLWHPE